MNVVVSFQSQFTIKIKPGKTIFKTQEGLAASLKSRAPKEQDVPKAMQDHIS